MTPNRACEIYIDGASRGNPGPAGIGAVFFDGRPIPRRGLPSLAGEPLLGIVPSEAKPSRGTTPSHQLSRYLGETTNNVAEYLALVYALQEALAAGYAVITVKTDSELLVRQISGRYKVRDQRLRLFHDLALHLMGAFGRCVLQHVPREQNRLADRLASDAARRKDSTAARASLTTTTSARG
jgi:ribonuclease HI